MKIWTRIPDEHFYQSIIIPWYLGFCWRDPLTCETVLVALPFNFVVTGARWLYYRLKHGWNLDSEIQTAATKAAAEGAARGYANGHVFGYHQGNRDGFEAGRVQGAKEQHEAIMALLPPKRDMSDAAILERQKAAWEHDSA
jgi:hypothetical protein